VILVPASTSVLKIDNNNTLEIATVLLTDVKILNLWSTVKEEKISLMSVSE